MNYMGRAARMQRHHKRHKGEAVINLVSMIDMLTILVFFLLVYSTEEVEVLPSAKDVQLPESIAEQHADDAVVVIVTETEILMEGQALGKIADILASDSVIIPALQSALENQTEQVLVDDAATNRGRSDREPRSHDHGGQGDSVPIAEEGDGNLDGGGLWPIVAGRPAKGAPTCRWPPWRRTEGTSRGRSSSRTVSNLRAAVVHGRRAGGEVSQDSAQLDRRDRRAVVADRDLADAGAGSDSGRRGAEAPRSPRSRARGSSSATAAGGAPRSPSPYPSPSQSSRSRSSRSPSPRSSRNPSRRPSTRRSSRASERGWQDCCRSHSNSRRCAMTPPPTVWTAPRWSVPWRARLRSPSGR